MDHSMAPNAFGPANDVALHAPLGGRRVDMVNSGPFLGSRAWQNLEIGRSHVISRGRDVSTIQARVWCWERRGQGRSGGRDNRVGRKMKAGHIARVKTRLGFKKGCEE